MRIKIDQPYRARISQETGALLSYGSDAEIIEQLNLIDDVDLLRQMVLDLARNDKAYYQLVHTIQDILGDFDNINPDAPPPTAEEMAEQAAELFPK